MSVHFNLGSHDGRMLDRLTETVKAAELHGYGCEAFTWEFDAQGQHSITCGEKLYAITTCCGELCRVCFEKPVDHVHEVIERFEAVSHD